MIATEIPSEDEVREATARDILADLADFLPDVAASERAGMLAAIEIIRANYPH